MRNKHTTGACTVQNKSMTHSKVFTLHVTCCPYPPKNSIHGPGSYQRRLPYSHYEVLVCLGVICLPFHSTTYHFIQLPVLLAITVPNIIAFFSYLLPEDKELVAPRMAISGSGSRNNERCFPSMCQEKEREKKNDTDTMRIKSRN